MKQKLITKNRIVKKSGNSFCLTASDPGLIQFEFKDQDSLEISYETLEMKVINTEMVYWKKKLAVSNRLCS